MHVTTIQSTTQKARESNTKNIFFASLLIYLHFKERFYKILGNKEDNKYKLMVGFTLDVNTFKYDKNNSLLSRYYSVQ